MRLHQMRSMFLMLLVFLQVLAAGSMCWRSAGVFSNLESSGHRTLAKRLNRGKFFARRVNDAPQRLPIRACHVGNLAIGVELVGNLEERQHQPALG